MNAPIIHMNAPPFFEGSEEREVESHQVLLVGDGSGRVLAVCRDAGPLGDGESPIEVTGYGLADSLVKIAVLIKRIEMTGPPEVSNG